MVDNVSDPIGPWEDEQDILRKRMASLKNNGLNSDEDKEKQINKILQEREMEEVRSDLIEEEIAVKKALSILSGDDKKVSKSTPLPQVKSEEKDGKKVFNFYNCTITFN